MEGKIVVITGCSSGIGRDMAQTLSTTGYAVAATARNPESIGDIDARLKLQLDVTDEQSVQAAVEAVIRELGRIDVLVNNAGIVVYGAVEEVPLPLMQNMFDVNVFGVIRMIKACVPHMRQSGGGTIINISSNAGKVSMPVNGAYSATKFALEALTDALRVELSMFGIRVVAINPGLITSSLNVTGLAASAAILSNEASDYRSVYRKFVSITTEAKGSGPEAVTQAVKAAIETAQPQPRYSGAPSMLEGLLKLSESERDAQFKRAYGIA
jgi:NAD(P)-dependent dehydrogenase (short-subunit alcohol dehydrogenase family)